MSIIEQDNTKYAMLSALLPVIGLLVAATLAKTGAAAHVFHLAYAVLVMRA